MRSMYACTIPTEALQPNFRPPQSKSFLKSIYVDFQNEPIVISDFRKSNDMYVSAYSKVITHCHVCFASNASCVAFRVNCHSSYSKITHLDAPIATNEDIRWLHI